MGMEIRRVPIGWEHPLYESGNYKPMYDQTYDEAAKEWLEGCDQWRVGNHKDQPCKYYWEYDSPPDEEYHRPEFKSDPFCYQIYETISEGTPVSPVFATRAEMVKWLISEGYSQLAAENFVKSGWVPSMIMTKGGG